MTPPTDPMTELQACIVLLESFRAIADLVDRAANPALPTKTRTAAAREARRALGLLIEASEQNYEILSAREPTTEAQDG